MNRVAPMRASAGFTLLELLVAVVVIGLMSLALTPLFNQMSGSQQRAYIEKQKLTNQQIVGALLSYASNSTATGRLPASYTGSGRYRAIYNPADGSAAGLALTAALSQTGVDVGEINDDNTAARNVRVYQVVQGLTMAMPLYFRSGPLVTLTYDYGAVYMTACRLADTTCNPTAATTVPGTSSLMTSTNYASWTSSGTDGTAAFVSSLPVQEAMLATTVQRLDKVRDALLTYFRGQQITAAAGTTTNWYPNQTGASAAGSLAGATPATNQGCRDGWYDLSSGSVSVLATAGLAAAEFGLTAWGGAVQYCRDYDPTGTGTADAAPHYAALRIHANVSAGQAPDGAVPGNNIVLTF